MDGAAGTSVSFVLRHTARDTLAEVKYLFVVFGGTSSVRMVPDAEFGHAARVILKDQREIVSNTCDIKMMPLLPVFCLILGVCIFFFHRSRSLGFWQDIGAMERAATSLNQTDVGHLAGISHA